MRLEKEVRAAGVPATMDHYGSTVHRQIPTCTGSLDLHASGVPFSEPFRRELAAPFGASRIELGEQA
jgi:hypothetical protein